VGSSRSIAVVAEAPPLAVQPSKTEVPPITDDAHPVERADAQRNRQRLIEVALKAFSSGREKVALETIAKDAGVGIGTLYRHFPSREALVEAVYRSELARLCNSTDELLESLAPDEALRAWMGRYADFVGTKREMAAALRAVIASGAITSSQTRERLSAAIQTMLDAGARIGSLRGDVRSEDVSASLAGVLLASGAPDQREQADRMLDLLMDALRTPRQAGAAAALAPGTLSA
jgi:AcrR family transcriptional regulator